MRHTRSHTGNRRSHHALKAPTLSKCTHCGATHRPHHMCLECGYYNGRQVMDLTAQKAKRDARIKEKEERIRVESTGGATPAQSAETKEAVSTENESKKAKEKNKEGKPKPEPKSSQI